MGSTTREVVTLQIGHYSNFIGTHWWNIQVLLQAKLLHCGKNRDVIDPCSLSVKTNQYIGRYHYKEIIAEKTVSQTNLNPGIVGCWGKGKNDTKLVCNVGFIAQEPKLTDNVKSCFH